MADEIILTFSGDLKSIDEVVRKIDPTANTFDCYCVAATQGRNRRIATHEPCYACSWPGTFEITFKRDGNELRKFGKTRLLTSKRRAAQNIIRILLA